MQNYILLSINILLITINWLNLLKSIFHYVFIINTKYLLYSYKF